MRTEVKERVKTATSVLTIIICLCAFWIFLFYGVVAEQDRREGQKSNRRWVQERALNQWETEQDRPELMKAIRMVAHDQER